METWATAILCSFLGYLLLHLIVDDLIRIMITYYKYKNAHLHRDPPVPPNTPEHQEGVENQATSDENVVLYLASDDHADVESGGWSAQPKRLANSTSSAERSIIVLIIYKICDTISYCVAGYFHTFRVCWCACLTALEVVMSKYFGLLEVVVKSLTAYPGSIYLCITAVLSLCVGCMMIYVILH